MEAMVEEDVVRSGGRDEHRRYLSSGGDGRETDSGHA